MKGARGRCGGCQRGFVRLRRVEKEERELGFCACVEVGLGEVSHHSGGERVPEAPSRMRETFPHSGKGSGFQTVRHSRRLLVAVATA